MSQCKHNECECNLIEIQTITDAVLLKGFSPYVADNGNWYEYDETTQQYIDTGIHAKGDKGDTYTITEADYTAIGNIVTEREESRFNQFVEVKKGEINTFTDGEKTELNTFTETKKSEINSHTSSKVNEYNSNATTKTEAYNSNANAKLSNLNANALMRTAEFNDNATTKTNLFDTNALNKTTAFNTNASNKTSEFNANVSAQIEAIDTHAVEKIEEYDAHAVEKIAEFDENARVRTSEFDAHIGDYAKQQERNTSDIAMLKWKTMGLATMVEDDREAYEKDVPSGVYEVATFDKLGGKSVVMNQLLDMGNIRVMTDFLGVTAKKENGAYIVSGTTTQVANITISENDIPIAPNHKVFVSLNGKIEESYFKISQYNGISWASDSLLTANAIITTLANTTNLKLLLYAGSEKTISWNIRPKLVDLSQLFGIGNEPTSTDDIRIKLLDKYLEANPSYNEGSLVSADVESVVSRGVNIWDEQWERCRYDINNGTKIPQDAQIGSKNYIPILPNTNYTWAYLPSVETSYHWQCYYDINKNFISAKDTSFRFTTPANAYYMTFYMLPQYGSTYNNDIAIVKGTSGTYTPYFESIKPLSTIISKYFPNGMHSAGSVYDEIDIDKGVAIKRVDSVDLGTFMWEYDSTHYQFRTTATLPNTQSYSVSTKANALCSKYVSNSAEDSWVNNKIGTICVNANNKVEVYDNAYTNANDFKNAMNGVMLQYELATPIETPIDSADLEALRSLQVEAGGTITFENAQFLEVPNKETYLVKVV